MKHCDRPSQQAPLLNIPITKICNAIGKHRDLEQWYYRFKLPDSLIIMLLELYELQCLTKTPGNNWASLAR